MSEKTHAELIAEQLTNIESLGDELPAVIASGALRKLLRHLDEAHNRELDAFKQRCAELNAEFAAKDEVIKRLNDAIAEEQRRKMAPPENPSAVGDAEKLREALEAIISGYENADLCDTNYGEWCHEPENPCVNVLLCKAIHEALAALAAPPRNCDVYTSDELKVIFNSELASELPIANEHEKNLVAITAMEVIDTLLAPATEKEGGAK